MGDTVTLMGLNLAAVMAMMVCAWILSLIIKNAGIADIFWGLGFVLIAWLTFFLADGYHSRKILLAVLVSIWGLRLAAYIGLRTRGKGEDHRYQTWRAQHGNNFWWVSLFNIFGLQGILLWVISLVVQAGQIASEPEGLGWMDVSGFMIWTSVLFLRRSPIFSSIGLKPTPSTAEKLWTVDSGPIPDTPITSESPSSGGGSF